MTWLLRVYLLNYLSIQALCACDKYRVHTNLMESDWHIRSHVSSKQLLFEISTSLLFCFLGDIIEKPLYSPPQSFPCCRKHFFSSLSLSQIEKVKGLYRNLQFRHYQNGYCSHSFLLTRSSSHRYNRFIFWGYRWEKRRREEMDGKGKSPSWAWLSLGRYSPQHLLYGSTNFFPKNSIRLSVVFLICMESPSSKETWIRYIKMLKFRKIQWYDTCFVVNFK